MAFFGSSWDEDVADSDRREVEKLRRLLWKERERLWMLQGRMRACNEEHRGNPDQHDLSIFEIDGWVEEIDEAIGKKK